VNAPAVGTRSAAAEVGGDPLGEQLGSSIPLSEMENNVASTLPALTVGGLYLWLCRRAAIPTALLLAAIYAFGTSMLSTVSRAVWNIGPALVLTNVVLFLLDEHLRPQTRLRTLLTTVGLAILPV
jgi:hypothetical protein